MVPFSYQPQEADPLKRNNQGDSLLLKDIWGVTISGVLVPEFWGSDMHRRMRKGTNSPFPGRPVSFVAHLAASASETHSSEARQGGSNLFIFHELINQASVHLSDIY